MSDVTPQRAAAPVRSAARSAVGWLVSIACLALIAANVDLAGAAAAVARFDWPLLLPALVALSCGYCLRIVRWTAMLRSTGANIDARRCAAPFLGSIALNNLLPLRAGDILRGTVFPASIGVSRTVAIGSIVMERLLDLLTLVAFLALGALALDQVRLPAFAIEATLALALVGIAGLMAIVMLSGRLAELLSRQARRWEGGRLRGPIAVLRDLLQAVRHMSRPASLAAVLVMSVAVWLGEAAFFHFILLGSGIASSPLVSLLVVGLVTLSTLLPSSPGYVGPFHLAAFGAATLLGVDAETATSFAVVSHLALWLPTTLAGALAMLVQPDMFRMARRQAASGPGGP